MSSYLIDGLKMPGITLNRNARFTSASESRYIELQAWHILARDHDLIDAQRIARGNLAEIDRRTVELYGVAVKDIDRARLNPATVEQIKHDYSIHRRQLAIAEKAMSLHNRDLGLSRACVRSLGQLAENVATFVAKVKGTLVDAKPVKGVKDPGALLAKLSTELEQTLAAWPTLIEAKAELSAAIAGRAALPTVVVREKHPPFFTERMLKPQCGVAIEYPTRWTGKERETDPLALVLALNKDAIIKRGHADIEAKYADHAGLILSAAERDAGVKRLKAAKLEAERHLAEAFWSSAARGDYNADLPADIDSRAVLGVE